MVCAKCGKKASMLDARGWCVVCLAYAPVPCHCSTQVDETCPTHGLAVGGGRRPETQQEAANRRRAEVQARHAVLMQDPRVAPLVAAGFRPGGDLLTCAAWTRSKDGVYLSFAAAGFDESGHWSWEAAGDTLLPGEREGWAWEACEEEDNRTPLNGDGPHAFLADILADAEKAQGLIAEEIRSRKAVDAAARQTRNETRRALARRANQGTGPRLTAASPRAAVLAWLAWNDRNGTFSDADTAAEGAPPLTEAEAWALVADAVEGQD